MELGPRDRLSQAFMKELEKGAHDRDAVHGDVVHLDLRHLGEKKINAKIPFVRELCLKYQNLDPIKDLIPVRPVVHYMMGGVHTDIERRDPAARPVRRRRSARASASTARIGSARTRCQSCWSSARAPARAAAEYASHGRDVNPACSPRRTTRSVASSTFS